MIKIIAAANHGPEPCILAITPPYGKRHEYPIAAHAIATINLELRDVPYFALDGDAVVTIQISRNGKSAHLQFGPNSDTKAMLT